jgi:hypothetical protein
MLWLLIFGDWCYKTCRINFHPQILDKFKLNTNI